MGGRFVSIRAPDGALFQAYIAGDVSPSRPGLMIFSPIFGIDEDMKAQAQKWAARGFLAAIPDYFFRVRPGPLDRAEPARTLAMERWQALDVDRAVTDMQGLEAYLRSSSSCNGKIAALGFCAGGELAFLAGVRLGVKAIAAFHGTHIDRHLNEASQLAAKATLHYGDNDPLVPIEQVEAIRTRFTRDPRVDVHVYPGAGHGFSFAGRPSYHEVAATASDRCAERLFDELK